MGYGISVLGPMIHGICIPMYTLYSTCRAWYSTYRAYAGTYGYMLSWAIALNALYMDIPTQRVYTVQYVYTVDA